MSIQRNMHKGSDLSLVPFPYFSKNQDHQLWIWITHGKEWTELVWLEEKCTGQKVWPQVQFWGILEFRNHLDITLFSPVLKDEVSGGKNKNHQKFEKNHPKSWKKILG